jgi:hypothetical protein
MKGTLALVGMSVGGWVGWAIGAPFSIFIAFLISIVGTGVGLYVSNLFARRFLP